MKKRKHLLNARERAIVYRWLQHQMAKWNKAIAAYDVMPLGTEWYVSKSKDRYRFYKAFTEYLMVQLDPKKRAVWIARAKAGQEAARRARECQE